METIGVLFNNCYGGFGFSDQFREEYKHRTGKTLKKHAYDFERHDIDAVKLFLEKGSKWSSCDYSKIDIEYIPVFMKEYYHISDYDGMEDVCKEVNRAIVHCLDEYLKDPTSEKLEWLKEQVKLIRSV